MVIIFRMERIGRRLLPWLHGTLKAELTHRSTNNDLLRCYQANQGQTLAIFSPAVVRGLSKVSNGFLDKCFVGCNCSSSQRPCSTVSSERDSTLLEKVEINQHISKLLGQATKVDIMISSMKRDKLIKELEDLINQGYPEHHLSVLCKNSQVFYNLPQFTQLVKTLLDLGYTPKDIPVLISNKPSIMEIDSEDFMTYFRNLNSLGLITRKIVRITSRSPEVLNIDLKKMQERVSELSRLFKTKDVFSLIEKSPHVLYCDIHYITERFAYVTQEMGITQRQIMYSQLFNLPLEHLHARHMFLVRTGFFKKAVNDKQVSNNPTLDEIIDTSDKVFLERFGGLSLKEYEVFKALLTKDRVITKEKDKTNDSDSDDEA